MGLNRSIIMGRLTADPVLKYTKGNIAVTSFTLAVQRDFKDAQTGERGTDFLDIVAWKNTAGFVCNYFHKGSMMIVEGRLQTRTWEDTSTVNGMNIRRKSVEIVAQNVYFGESSPNRESNAQSGTYAAPAPSTGGGYGYGGEVSQTQTAPEYSSGADYLSELNSAIAASENLPF